MNFAQLTDFPLVLKGILELSENGVKVLDADKFKSEIIDELIYAAVFSPVDDVRQASRWIIWEAAHALGITSASIHDLYMARGKGKYKDVCVPAVNIRAMTYDSARAMFRALQGINAGPALFEIAKSEIGYTVQPPKEYATCILAAAIKEGHSGPVCIQGDHFQVNAKKYASNPDAELASVKTLIDEAIAAGFYNIDIDTSTLVDLDQPTIPEQQRINFELGARLTAHIRKLEPEGVTVSVGGEIGEVGGKNSTAEELAAYLDGYNEQLEAILPGSTGLSKVSIQTGTSHGGVPLPDGSVAEVALDFGVLEELGKLARDTYGLSGSVQHGASTLPDEAFHRFKETQTAEVHLATGFQNLIYDHPKFPAALKERIYAWLNVNCSGDRKSGQTDEQFLYKTRKKGFGPFKWETWNMDADTKAAIMGDLEKKFTFLFEQLGLKDSAHLVPEFLSPKHIAKPIPGKLKELLADASAFGEKHGAEKDAPGAD